MFAHIAAGVILLVLVPMFLWSVYANIQFHRYGVIGGIVADQYFWGLLINLFVLIVLPPITFLAFFYFGPEKIFTLHSWPVSLLFLLLVVFAGIKYAWLFNRRNEDGRGRVRQLFDLSAIYKQLVKLEKRGSFRRLHKDKLVFSDVPGPLAECTLPNLLLMARDRDPTVWICLGMVFEEGNVGSADSEVAVFWYKKVVDSGEPEGLYHLSRIYARAGDYAKAYDCLYRAADLGHDESIEALANDRRKKLQADYPVADSNNGTACTQKTVLQSVVSDILVRRSAVESDRPYDLIHNVIDFVNFLRQKAIYLPAEQPQAALQIYYVDYYRAQVCNGGHAQYVFNSDWNPLTVAPCLSGLEALAIEPFQGLFKRLSALMSDREFSDRHLNNLIYDDEELKSLDREFYGSDPDALISAMYGHLLNLPELRVVEDEKYVDTLQQLLPHPAHEVRRLSVQKAEWIDLMCNPVQVAARMLCFKATFLPIYDITGGNPAGKAPDGRESTAWAVHSDCGIHNVFMFEDSVVLSETYLADGRRSTPAITREFRQRVLSPNWDGYDIYADAHEKEILRLPISTVEAAIQAALEKPIVESASLLCSKLGPDEGLRSFMAPYVSEAGDIGWLIETQKNRLYMEFSDTGPMLLNLSRELLVEVSLADVTASQSGDEATATLH